MGIEYIAEVDWNDNILARRRKNDLHDENFIHRVSLVIPQTVEGKLIIAKRAPDKHPFPGVWCCAIGGRVRFDETYEEAAHREMREEVSMQAHLIEMARTRMDNPEERAHYTIFTTEPVRTEHLTPCRREIERLAARHPYEISHEIDDHPLFYAPAFRIAFKAFYQRYLFTG